VWARTGAERRRFFIRIAVECWVVAPTPRKGENVTKNRLKRHSRADLVCQQRPRKRCTLLLASYLSTSPTLRLKSSIAMPLAKKHRQKRLHFAFVCLLNCQHWLGQVPDLMTELLGPISKDCQRSQFCQKQIGFRGRLNANPHLERRCN
jgi:hypothetical protein